jgi:hypothetical protein
VSEFIDFTINRVCHTVIANGFSDVLTILRQRYAAANNPTFFCSEYLVKCLKLFHFKCDDF